MLSIIEEIKSLKKERDNLVGKKHKNRRKSIGRSIRDLEAQLEEEPPLKRVKTSKKTPVNGNYYSGWRVPHSGAPIDHIDVSTVDPETFFKNYILKRKPCILTGDLSDPSWQKHKSWTNSYLSSVAGQSIVRVECRKDNNQSYGKGKYERMTFHEFLVKMESGDCLHYLSTQDLGTDAEGRPDLMSSPCSELFSSGDFPLVPSLMGNLVPMNYNVWMGNSKNNSSSGLHHDFHDNLYVLLRGKKRFRLFSPADAELMHTVGRIKHVYPNGRICYDSNQTEMVGADGVEPSALRAMDASLKHDAAALAVQKAENALQEFDAANKKDENKTKRSELCKALKVCEAQQELALEAIMEMEFDGCGGYNKEEMDNFTRMTDDNDNKKTVETKTKQTVPVVEPTPDHFSKVNVNLSPIEIASKFPLYAKAALARETFATINAGEMLFLPAGWFHEVSSLSSLESNKNCLAEYNEKNDNTVNKSSASDSVSGIKGTGRCGHFAFNFWFHPPDNNRFDSPYKSQFWKRDWDARNE